MNYNQSVVYPEQSDASLHYCYAENLEEVDVSGLITLLFDEKSTSIGVSIMGSGNNIWSALPQAETDAAQSVQANVIQIELLHEKQRYALNTQDNSVAIGGASWKKTDDGFTVTYLITDNSSIISNIGSGAGDETYSAAAENSILFKVNVNYSLKDGCLYADLDWLNLGNSNDVLINIGFLNYFGASANAASGDFILVPDGSGAVIDLACEEAVEPVSIAVYGNDLNASTELSAVVPAFGIKSGENAAAVIIEEGDAVATINAFKADGENDFNSVGATFNVTPYEIVDGVMYFAKTAYTEKISLCYRFLSDSDATYSGMASACREQLIRNYTLSTRSVEKTEHFPVLINVIGQAEKGKFISYDKSLTKFEQAQDMLTRIKSKGVNNVYLRYSGALSGGMNGQNAEAAEPIKRLGGKRGLRILDEYASGLNFKIFVDVDVMSDSKKNDNAITGIKSRKYQYALSNSLVRSGFIEEAPQRRAVSVTSLEKTVLSLLERFNGYDATGYCVNDLGASLHTDIKAKLSRQAVSKQVREALIPLSTNSSVMVVGGNFYAIKNADVVSALPMTCGRATNDAYKCVPFVQMILHGIVEFSFDELNLQKDFKTATLRCIEYGAIPGFVLSNNSYDGSEKYNSAFGIDSWLNSIYDCYNYIGGALNDLRSSRITNHYALAQGVYCTEFETTKIYVNYTQQAFSVNGITVEPMNFFRVN